MARAPIEIQNAIFVGVLKQWITSTPFDWCNIKL